MSEMQDGAKATMNALMEVDILLDEYRDQHENGHMQWRDYRKVRAALTVLRQRIAHSFDPSISQAPSPPEPTNIKPSKKGVTEETE
jgi:hypothetical protein